MAQLISLVVLVFSSKFYEPNQFGEFGYYISLSVILSVCATGTLDQAIAISRDLTESTWISISSLLIAIFFLLVLLLLIATLYFIDYFLGFAIDDILSEPWIFPAILNGFFISVSNIIFLNLVKHGQIRSSALLKISIQVVIGIFIGMFGLLDILQVNGLVYGTLLGNFLVAVIFIIHSNSLFFRSVSFDSTVVWNVISKYRSYALYQLPSQVLNGVGLGIPVFAIGLIFGDYFAGVYVLATKIVVSPFGLVFKGVGEFFKVDFSKKFHSGCDLVNTFYMYFSLIFVLCVGLLIFYGGFWSFISSYFFEAEWALGADIAKILLILAFVQGLSVPLSCTVLLFEKFKFELFFQFLRVVLVSASLAFSAYLQTGFLTSVLNLVVAVCVSYCGHLAFQIWLTHRGQRKFCSGIRGS